MIKAIHAWRGRGRGHRKGQSGCSQLGMLESRVGHTLAWSGSMPLE